MQAALFHRYGSPEVFNLEQVPVPTPKADEIQVRVRAVAITAADRRIRASKFPPGHWFMARLIFGLFKPRRKILGSCFSGTVTAVGANVSQFAVGDEVFGMTGMSFGAYAEYLTVKEHGSVIKKPATLSHPQAAALAFGGTTALYFLKERAGLKKGQVVLINGASGSVGTNAVQLAKYFGATVIGVCSTKKIAQVKNLGADQVIDYRKEKVVSRESAFDVVMDVVGNLSIAEGENLLRQGGKFLLVSAGLADLLRANLSFLWPKSKKEIQLLDGIATETKEALNFLAKLVVNGQLKVVIDKTFPLSKIVEAHKYTDSGRKIGNVVLEVL
jgi:NADPH:quinone reductase-like Zn-dependent oxidoreductase